MHQPPGRLYLEGRFNGGFFASSVWGGLYLERLMHGGAYFWNFTVCSTESALKSRSLIHRDFQMLR